MQKVRRQRASSARPSTGPSKRIVNKADFIDNLYVGIKQRHGDKDPKAIQRLSLALGEENDKLLSISRRYKEPEELYEENMRLKKQVNRLNKQIELSRGKVQTFKRKNSQYTKKLNMQYEKQIYWGSTNTNLVMGIKNQYETIKEKYDLKCRQYDDLVKEYLYCASKEDKTYISVLEEENQKLKKCLKDAREEMKVLQHGTITSSVDQSLDDYRKCKFQLQQANLNIANQLQGLKIENSTLESNLQQKTQKIQFLDKLLIEKDNNDHASRKKLKKLVKQKQDLLQAYITMKQQKQLRISHLQEQLKRVKDIAQRQAERQIAIFRKQMQEKSDRAAKLEKQVAYLTTLMSYWKPIDQINQLVANNLIGQNSALDSQGRNVLLQYSQSMLGSMNIRLTQSKQQKRNIHIEDDDNKSITQSMLRASRRGSVSASRRGSIDGGKQFLDNRNVSDVLTKSIDLPKEVEKERVKMTADKKQSQDGVKCRKVKPEEIVDIGETLMYRFIGLNIPIEEVKKCFDYKPDENDLLMTEQEENWKREYINMQEVLKILSSDIFGLDENGTETLGRYLIEDSATDYVYRDLVNEELREKVKSIMKTVLKDYEIKKNREEIKGQAEELISKYETNLQAALKTTYPKGIISKKKLLELFKGLGIELSEDIQDYLIGKVVIKSSNLENLNYKILFEK